jgi:tRNA threonylcarbamoyladenosine biosynthesis protein TsaB
MHILAVDTCDTAGSAAVLHNSRLLGEINIDSKVTHSQRLLTAVDFLMRDLNLEIAGMDGYAVAAGPGSFTGIRIGISTVKSLSFSFQKPIAPVSRLKALAFKLAGVEDRLICPFLDAKKNQVYAALYNSSESEIKAVFPEGAYDPDDFLSRLPRGRVVRFIGSGTDIYVEKLKQHLRDKAVISHRSFFAAHEIGCLGYGMIKNNQGRDSRDVTPIYLRKSQAEEKY